MLMITGVASVGTGADTLYYAYRPGLSQLETATWRNSQDAVLNSRTYAYDAYQRLTGINLNNASEVAYTLNDKDQRTAASYAVGGAWSYSYDDKSQVTGATGNNTIFSYAYDGIGNRLTAAEGSDTWSYTSNLLNQYTAINSNQPTYDADGNMLTTGDGWTYTWNGENRLIRAVKGGAVVEMAYDYMGCRISKTTTGGTFLDFFTSGQHNYRYVYDEYKLIAVYDGNDLVMTFTWQPDSVNLDVPVSMTYDGETYYYVTDGNKNVIALLDAEGNRVAEYAYGPFGQILHMEGELAEINPLRFSSEYYDDETELIYYNYRYFSPKLGRWIKRDPINEYGGVNIYCFVANNPINDWDWNGLGRIRGVVKLYKILANGKKQFLKTLTAKDVEGIKKLTKEAAKAKDMPRGVIVNSSTKTQAKKIAKQKGRKVIFEVDKKTNSPHFHSAKGKERTAVHFTWDDGCYGITFIPVVGDYIEIAEIFREVGTTLADATFEEIKNRAEESSLGTYVMVIRDETEAKDEKEQKVRDREGEYLKPNSKGQDRFDIMMEMELNKYK